MLYGSSSGISTTDDQFVHQDISGVFDQAETGDQFGFSLTSGDFDGRQGDDLAVGVPLEDIGVGTAAIADAGAVSVFYGRNTTGLTATGNFDDDFWHQNQSNVLDQAEAGDQFGFALVAGNFDDDSEDDLAIGVPFESIGFGTNEVITAGAVSVLYGAGNGLTADNDEFLHQDVFNTLDEVEQGDQFGYELAAGDFTGDGTDDLAVGVPFEDIRRGTVNVADAGAVAVFYGLAGAGLLDGTRLALDDDDFFHQDVTLIFDVVEVDDRFGFSLAVGRFDAGPRADLAIGVPSEDLSTPRGDFVDGGAVNVLYSNGDGLQTVDEFWHQDIVGILDQVEAGDQFGRKLGRR